MSIKDINSQVAAGAEILDDGTIIPPKPTPEIITSLAAVDVDTIKNKVEDTNPSAAQDTADENVAKEWYRNHAVGVVVIAVIAVVVLIIVILSRRKDSKEKESDVI
jgi:hypothetical protein